MDGAIVLAPGVREKIALHLRSTYPNEGCGVLVASRVPGAEKQIVDALPVRNISDCAGHRFVLDPLEYGRLEERLSKSGRRIAGFFHSHPDGVAQPSQEDLDSAKGLYEFLREPMVYVIQCVTAEGVFELTAWRLNSLSDAFVEVPVA